MVTVRVLAIWENRMIAPENITVVEGGVALSIQLEAEEHQFCLH